MSTLSITLAAWNAWEQSSTYPDTWNQITTDGAEQSHASLPKAQRIPAMLRRRLGSLGKTAITSADELIAKIDDAMPTVFCSQHGDLNRTLELLQSLALSEPLSPTHFSLSVHNAIAGIYSIARKDHSPTTAISCAQDDVSSALLETQLILEEQKSQYALCVVYDEPLPERYSTTALPTKAYAASFLLCANPNLETQELELSAGTRNKPYTTELTAHVNPSALQMVQFLNQDIARDLCFELSPQIWHWKKVQQEQKL